MRRGHPFVVVGGVAEVAVGMSIVWVVVCLLGSPSCCGSTGRPRNVQELLREVCVSRCGCA